MVESWILRYVGFGLILAAIGAVNGWMSRSGPIVILAALAIGAVVLAAGVGKDLYHQLS